MRLNTNNINSGDKEKKNMELWLKILIGIAGIGGVALISYGVYTLQTAKDTEIKDNITVFDVVDHTQSTNATEQLVDNTIQYQEEAKELFNQHKDELVCTENQFIAKFVDYRNNGLTKEQAFNSLYNEFYKGYQNDQRTESGEAIAKPTEMDTYINSYDDNITEEVTAPIENPVINFEIEELDPTNLYAIQDVNLRQGPSADDFEKIGSLSAKQQVTVVGIVKEYQGQTVLWYQLDTGEFVSGAYLVEKLPAETAPQQQQPVINSDGTISVGGFTLSFPEGTSNGFEGMEYTGPATMEGAGVDPNFRLQ